MPEGSKTERLTGRGTGAVAGSSGLATVIVWGLGEAGVSVSAEIAALVSGLLGSVALFVWHTGLKNILRGVWHGKGTYAPSG